MKMRLLTLSTVLVGTILLALSPSILFDPVVASPPEPTPVATLAEQWGMSFISPEGETGTEWQTAPADADEVWAYANQRAYENQVLRLINKERTKRGLWPLRRNAILTANAHAHNQDMIVNHFFGHQGSDGRWAEDRAKDGGYGPYCGGNCFVGENIAAGYTTPAAVVAGWMASKGHRDNILNADYREIGVGYNEGGRWGTYWTTPFGSQPNVLPVFINNDALRTRSRRVKVALSNETVSGCPGIDRANQVMISNNRNFRGARWQRYRQTKRWTLTRRVGRKVVYVKFRAPSNEAVTSKDTIRLR